MRTHIVPFFTTKPGDSGTDLCLYKQITLLHHSHTAIHSKAEEGTVLQLIFYKN